MTSSMTDWVLPPLEIERRSFAIIDAEAGEHSWPPDQWSVLRRMIHTTADFEYVSGARFHPGAVEAGVAALRSGAAIVTDTNMAKSGISRARLAAWGNPVECYIAHPEVAAIAKERGITRAMAAADHAAALHPKGIHVIGNAPTALFRLLELIEAGQADPALVVGLPVGFVNAAESKAALVKSPAVYISNQGRKGGSNLAAAVINALAELAKARV